MFPELVEPLRDAYEQAESGAEFVIEKNWPASVRNKAGNWQAVNIRTQFEKVINAPDSSRGHDSGRTCAALARRN